LWRRLMNRPSVHRLRARTLWIALSLFALALLAGCGRGLRHESWPGLMVTDNTIYAANLEQVQALNAETGKVYWSYPFDEERELRPFYSTPVIAPERDLLLVAGFADQTVYALALGSTPAERPDEAWRFAEAGGQYVGSGTVAGGLFIIGNGDGSVYALNLEDGSEVWQFATNDRVWATPTVVDDTVYVASLDHHLYALDLETGAEKWQIETSGSISATPLYADGDLWIGDFASTLYRVDLETQDVVWTHKAQDWLWSTPLLDDNVLYFADVGGGLYALDVETQTLLWESPALIDDTIHGQPALNADGSLLFVAGYEKGGVYAVDTSTGSLQEGWAETLENPGRLPGDLVSDEDRLYAMPILVAERIQAYDLQTGEVIWSIPSASE
ncbi:MAG: PQQ-binding-like beta-propeller repeat protein, partial [Anaerolineae bacterium]